MRIALAQTLELALLADRAQQTSTCPVAALGHKHERAQIAQVARLGRTRAAFAAGRLIQFARPAQASTRWANAMWAAVAPIRELRQAARHFALQDSTCVACVELHRLQAPSWPQQMQ